MTLLRQKAKLGTVSKVENYIFFVHAGEDTMLKKLV